MKKRLPILTLLALAMALGQGGKARAALRGRTYVSQEDVRAVAAPVLRHRIRTNFSADAEGIVPDDIVRRLVEFTASEFEKDVASGDLPQVFRSADAG